MRLSEERRMRFFNKHPCHFEVNFAKGIAVRNSQKTTLSFRPQHSEERSPEYIPFAQGIFPFGRYDNYFLLIQI